VARAQRPGRPRDQRGQELGRACGGVPVPRRLCSCRSCSSRSGRSRRLISSGPTNRLIFLTRDPDRAGERGSRSTAFKAGRSLASRRIIACCDGLLRIVPVPSQFSQFPFPRPTQSPVTSQPKNAIRRPFHHGQKPRAAPAPLVAAKPRLRPRCRSLGTGVPRAPGGLIRARSTASPSVSGSSRLWRFWRISMSPGRVRRAPPRAGVDHSAISTRIRWRRAALEQFTRARHLAGERLPKPQLR